MAIFKREDSRSFKMSQEFIDGLLTTCPFCESDNPNWLVAHEIKLINNESLFQCERCGAIIRMKDSDISGESKIKYTTRGLFKIMEKKEPGVLYVKIENIGNVSKKYELINTEIDIKILFNISESIKQKKVGE